MFIRLTKIKGIKPLAGESMENRHTGPSLTAQGLRIFQ